MIKSINEYICGIYYYIPLNCYLQCILLRNLRKICPAMSVSRITILKHRFIVYRYFWLRLHVVKRATLVILNFPKRLAFAILFEGKPSNKVYGCLTVSELSYIIHSNQPLVWHVFFIGFVRWLCFLGLTFLLFFEKSELELCAKRTEKKPMLLLNVSIPTQCDICRPKKRWKNFTRQEQTIYLSNKMLFQKCAQCQNENPVAFRLSFLHVCILPFVHLKRLLQKEQLVLVRWLRL